MFRILVKKYINESRLLWMACALLLLFFPWIRIWTVSQFELSGFEPILKQFRAFEKFSPVPLDQFLTYHGMIGLTYDEPVLILGVLVWCIARGSDVVSGELGRGTMEMLLAQPVSRSRIFVAHGLVTILGLMLLCGIFYVGLTAGIEFNSTWVRRTSSFQIPFLNFEFGNPFELSQGRMVPLSELVSPSVYAVPTMNLFAFGFAVLGLSVMVSCFEQYRWRTIGIVIGIYVLQLLLFILSKSTPKLNALKPFSFIAAYQPDWIIQRVYRNPEAAWAWRMETDPSSTLWNQWMDGVGPMGYVSILIVLGVTFHFVGYIRFCKRDLPAPQ